MAAQKKVVIRQFEGGLKWGYLPAIGFLDDSQVTLMEVDGRSKFIDFNHIKTICYVRDFNLDDPTDPERLGRRVFQGRPRGEGIWLRLTFQDGESLEGLSAFDMTFIDALIDERGIFLTPPDPRSNVLRVFVPRPALASLEVLGYVTSPSRRPVARPARDSGQPTLFAE